MPESLIPFSRLLNDGEKVDFISIKFTEYSPIITVQEEYCVNPGCSCTDVVLRFFEMSDEGKPINELFLLKLDMSSWKITGKTILNKTIKAEQMIQEFVADIDQVKSKLLSHYVRAKEYGKKNYLDYISDNTIKMVLDGDMVTYAEIFGGSDYDNFGFAWNETEKWTFDDQYCSNPKCLCNEVVLSFYKINLSKQTQEPEFAVRMNLKNFKYNVEYNNNEQNQISEIISFLKGNKPEVIKALRSRYNEVKRASKEIIKKSASKEKEEALPNVKIGRNDPCPCGSGKKYKKCCGK
ncbi:SEC-C motif protein [anaerobic digester metagenome]